MLLLAGCAHHVTRIDMEPLTVEKKPSGELEVVEPLELFARARTAFEAQKWAEAARDFDRLASVPDPRTEDAALYNAGLAHEALAEWPAAAEHYRTLLQRNQAKPEDLVDGAFRLGAVLVEQKDFRGAVAVYDQLLISKGLSAADRPEVETRRGVALLGAGDLAAADSTLRQVVQRFRKANPEDQPDPFFPSMAAFYLGEVAHERFRQQPLRLDKLTDDVDNKAELLIAAEQRYVDTMKLKHPEWATAAASQIASLYRELYDALSAVPIPPNLDAEARKVYEDELKRQLQTLLRRALAVHEQTVLLAQRIGVANEWVTRSNEEMQALRKLLVQPPDKVTPLPAPERRPLPVPRPRDDVRPRPVL